VFNQACMNAALCRALDNDRHCSFCVAWSDNELGESIGHRSSATSPTRMNKKEKTGLVNNQLATPIEGTHAGTLLRTKTII